MGTSVHSGNLTRPETKSFSPGSVCGNEKSPIQLYSSGYQTSPIQYQPSSSRQTSSIYDRGTTELDEIANLARLENELVAKEASIKREMAYLNQHQSPWSRPRQIREPRREPQARVVKKDQRWVKECLSPSTSRPTSRASSTKSTTEADLLEKASKLLLDVEEIEKKQLNQQQILIEGGVRKVDSPVSEAPSSIHTAIIKVPRGEINNKSPLPFSYDNFSTLGVRGNIASVGAAEPEAPYPPIFPTIKRTQ